MKRSIFTILSALLAGILIVACSQQNDPSENLSASAPQEKIVIGLDDNFPPMGFRDSKGEIVGFDIDLAREAAKRMNVRVSFMPIDWSTKEDELTSKRIDAIWNGFSVTEERKKTFLFSQPYMQNHQIVIVTANSPIQSKADLKGKVVGVQDGSSAVEAVTKDEELAKSMKEIKKFGDNVTALMDLTTGRLDAVVVDEVVGRYYTSQKAGQYRILSEDLGSEDYGVGLRKEDTALLAKLEEALAAMNADGTAKKIYAQWFEGAAK